MPDSIIKHNAITGVVSWGKYCAAGITTIGSFNCREIKDL